MRKFCIILSAKYEEEPKVYKKDVYYASLQDSTFMKYDGKNLVTDATMPNCILQMVSYHKKMYEANTLDIEIQAVIGKQDVDTAMVSYENTFKGATIDVIENMKPAAEESKMLESMIGYRICAVVPKEDTSATLDDNRTITIILKAFSPDKALDITPYCETFQDKTFGTIISKKLGTDGIFSNFNINCSYKPKGMIDGNGTEYKQPYLVQYNESFYQFLVRVANRCGQYVCYERGTLNIGKIDKSANYSKKKGDDNYMGAALIERDADYSYADSLIESELFASSYCDAKDKPEENTESKILENNEIVDNSQSSYIKKSDNYTAANDVITKGIEIVSVLGTYAQADSAVNVVANVGEKIGEIELAKGWIDKDLSDDFANVKGPACEHNKTLPISTEEAVPQDNDPTTITGPLTSEWYKAIVNDQRTAEKKKLTIIYKTHPNVFLLGDTLENNYIVTEIDGIWSYDRKEGQSKKETQVFFNHEVTAIGNVNGLGTPYLAEKRIRRATPHKAIVAQVNDPLRIGRVRVTFPWDKSQTMSPWIRISSPAAYENGGFLFTPAKGDEAMVDFEDGNIERPFVTGFMHTRTKKPYIGSRTYNKNAGMYKTLSKKDGKYSPNDPLSCVITNRTGQSITLENGKNSGGFFKGMIPAGGILMANNPDFLGGKDTSLGGSITLTDAYGVCTIKSDTGARSITIDSALGKVELSAFTGITVNCPNGDIKLKGKNITLEAGNNINIKSGGNKGMAGYQETTKSITTSVLQKGVALWDAHSAYNGSWSKKGVIDLSYIRAAFEVILRPLEGTTTIKTPGYIMLATGGGGDMSGYSTSHNDSFSKLQWAGWLKPIEKARKKYKESWMNSKNKGVRIGEGLLEGIVDNLIAIPGVSDSVADFSNVCETVANFKCYVAGNSPSGLIISTGKDSYKKLESDNVENNVHNNVENNGVNNGVNNGENEGREILRADEEGWVDLGRQPENNVNPQVNLNNNNNVRDAVPEHNDNALQVVREISVGVERNEARNLEEDDDFHIATD